MTQQGIYEPPKHNTYLPRHNSENIPWSVITKATIVHIISTSFLIVCDNMGYWMPSDVIIDELNKQWDSLPDVLLMYSSLSYWPEVTLLIISWILILLKKRSGLIIFTFLICLWWAWQLIDIDDASAGGYRFMLHASILSEGAIIALYLGSLYGQNTVVRQNQQQLSFED